MAFNYAKFNGIGDDNDDENEQNQAPAAKRGGNSNAFDGNGEDSNPLQDLLSLGKDASMAELMAKMKALPPSAKKVFLDKVGTPEMMKAAKDMAKAKGVPGDSLLKSAVDLGNGKLDLAAEPPRVEEVDDGTHAFVGKQVILSGLKARPELNGKSGSCLHFDSATGRYAVRIEGVEAQKLLKAENLDLA